MKIAIFILIFALGAMWYRGEIGSGHRPEEFGLPAKSKIPSLQETLAPELQEEGKSKKKAPSPAKTGERLSDADVAMLNSKDREIYNQWLAKRQQERTISEKLVNFFSHGKYE